MKRPYSLNLRQVSVAKIKRSGRGGTEGNAYQRFLNLSGFGLQAGEWNEKFQIPFAVAIRFAVRVFNQNRSPFGYGGSVARQAPRALEK
jgi:hypothetical protein